MSDAAVSCRGEEGGGEGPCGGREHTGDQRGEEQGGGAGDGHVAPHGAPPGEVPAALPAAGRRRHGRRQVLAGARRPHGYRPQEARSRRRPPHRSRHRHLLKRRFEKTGGQASPLLRRVCAAFRAPYATLCTHTPCLSYIKWIRGRPLNKRQQQQQCVM